MIFDGSRYQRADVARVLDAHRQQIIPTIFLPLVQPSPRITNFHYYTVIQGDRYDLIAARFYHGKADQWALIADANPEVPYPDNLPPGLIIRVPY